jgi:hypothetical protein
MHTPRTPTEHAAQSFVREHNIRFLKRALRAEADPDDRRVIRRLLREQERIYAAEPRDVESQ